jgi:hypothetical protein
MQAGEVGECSMSDMSVVLLLVFGRSVESSTKETQGGICRDIKGMTDAA